MNGLVVQIDESCRARSRSRHWESLIRRVAHADAHLTRRRGLASARRGCDGAGDGGWHPSCPRQGESAPTCESGAMKIFVTGGTGVVGQAAVTALVEAGHEVRLFSRHADEEVRAWPRGVEARAGSVADP